MATHPAVRCDIEQDRLEGHAPSVAPAPSVSPTRGVKSALLAVARSMPGRQIR